MMQVGEGGRGVSLSRNRRRCFLFSLASAKDGKGGRSYDVWVGKISLTSNVGNQTDRIEE